VSTQYKKKQMSKKKQKILKTATIMFAEKGFNETSIAELAKLTESAEGTIFYHFKTKNELFIKTLENVKEGILKDFDEYIKEWILSNGLEKTEIIISFLLYLAAHREEWFRLLQRHYTYEFAKENDTCREHLEAIYNTFIDLLENAVAEGIDDGSIPELPSRKIALILLSTITGAIWLKYQGIYDTSILYEELLLSCRKILVHTE